MSRRRCRGLIGSTVIVGGFIFTYLSVTSNTNDFSQKTQNNGIRFSSKIKRPKNDSVVQNYISAFTTSTDSKRIKIRVLI